MNTISNDALLSEVNRRLSLNEKTINEQQGMLLQMKELNRKLEQSEALKSHFISNIKNEINNPLAAILALSQNILRKSNALSPEVIKSLRLIYHEAHALDFQLDNIMMAAEIEAGQVAPQLVDANVSQIIEYLVGSFRSTIEKKTIHVNCLLDEQIHFVTDRHFFKVICANLISNAIKFSRDGGSISISLTHEIDHLTLIVKDEGTGIREQDVSRIFDRFIQLDSGTVKSYLGHGLGLSVTRALTELLDGSIDVSSGQDGATFSIHFPVKLSDAGITTAMEGGTEVLFDQSF
jgi:signal transduction histidine kinase